MSAVERIEAAIEKLDGLRMAASPGPWHQDVGAVENDDGWVIGDAAEIDDVELIVALYRSIDAQLAILRACVVDLVTPFAGMHQDPENFSREITLADAILGDAS